MMNDAQANSLVNGFLYPIRAYDWYLDPNGSLPEIVDRISRDYNLPIGPRRDGREWNKLRGARRFSFDNHLADGLRATWYGHYFFEQVGEVLDDGKWHLRKLGLRPPRTITEINVDKDGALRSIKQDLGPNNPPIPIDRLVAYVWDREGANWVGRSMLRCVYRNHLVKDRVMRVGAINIERAGGVPYAEAPEGASGDQIRELDALTRRFRVGEAAGAALPHGAQLKFAAAAGGDGAVARLKWENEEMARGFLQMVNMLGQTNSGSRALGGTFLDIAQIAQFTIAKWFCDTFNEHVIEDDVDFNEGPLQDYCPLLAFDPGGAHPLEGFQEAIGEDEGIQVVDPKLQAMLTEGVRHIPRSKIKRGGFAREASPRRSRPAITGRTIAAMATTQSDRRKVTFKEIEGTDGLLSMVYDVEICEVGIEYPLATGLATFTSEDLLQAVASQEDPAIKAPRVWLGHTDDDRFHAGRSTPAGSAEPALGKVVGLRVEDEGMTLVGDVEGCPTWLAKILASAYPSRSIEGYKDAVTATGRDWQMVVTDLALLGVRWPGVTTLDDLEALYSREGPDDVEVVEDDMKVTAAGTQLTAQIDIDDVRRAFQKQYSEIEGLTGWPWIRAMQLDPDEIIVDNEEGDLFRVPFSSKKDGSVEFGAAQKVKIKYVNAATLKANSPYRAIVAKTIVGDHAVTVYESREASTIAETTTQEVTMTPAQLRAVLGLSADATDAQVAAKTAELLTKAETPSPDQEGEKPAVAPDPQPPTAQPTPAAPSQPGTVTNPATPETPTPDQQPKGPDVLNPEPVVPPALAASVPAGMTMVPTEAWTTLQGQVAGLASKNEVEEKRVREEIVASAARAGKFFPYQREFYAAKVEDPKTRDAFVHLLTATPEQGGLVANQVPVEARGADPSGMPQQGEAYPSAWLPELAQRPADTKVTIGNEG